MGKSVMPVFRLLRPPGVSIMAVQERERLAGEVGGFLISTGPARSLHCTGESFGSVGMAVLCAGNGIAQEPCRAAALRQQRFAISFRPAAHFRRGEKLRNDGIGR